MDSLLMWIRRLQIYDRIVRPYQVGEWMDMLNNKRLLHVGFMAMGPQAILKLG